MADGVRSAGSLVGAVLESVGYHYQGHVLNTLSDPFTNELGGLIYLVGIVIAIGAVATQGSYKMGVWLLIGPPLFFSVILPRSNIPNARWQFAYRERDSAEVNTRVQEIMKNAQNAAGGGEANVSSLFARYVELISAVTNEMVKVIANERRDSDKWFIIRAELFGLMHTARIYDTDLLNLMHKSLFNDCQEVLEAARAAQDPIFRERKNSNPGRDEMDKTKTIEEARAYFAQRQKEAEDIYKNLLENQRTNLNEEAATYAAKIESATDVNARAQQIKQNGISCGEVWKLTLKAIERYAENEAKELLRRGEAEGIAGEAIVNVQEQAHGIKSDKPLTYDSADFSSAANVQKLQKIIAKFMFRNESRDPSKAARMAHFVTRLETRSVEGSFEGRNSETEKVRLGASEWAEKERLMHAAGSLPYYQGLGLYFLGTTFPFFALLLIMPGKQGGFILWFILWIWLKSWDVALAGIMLVDDILFSMLAVQKQTIGQKDGIPAEQQLDVMFASIGEMDPTFQLATYYTIIATAILAVPPTTAQLILGSLRSGATLVSAGVQKSADYFSQNTLVGTQQIALNALKSNALELKEDRMQRYMENANAGRVPHASETGADGKLQNPTNINPFKGYRRLAGSSQGGPNATPGNTDTAADAIRRLGQLASSSGFYQGVADAPRTVGSQSSPLIDAASKMFSARNKNIAGTEWQQTFKVLESDRRALAAHAEWDADIDQKAVRVHEQIALYGGIPIPWSNFTTESSYSEFDLALSRYSFKQEMLRAEWATRREQIEAFRIIATGVLGTLAERGSGEGDRLRSITDIANASPEQRQEIRERYSSFLSRTNEVARALKAPGARMVGTGLTALATSDDMNIWRQQWTSWGQRMYGKPKGGLAGLIPDGGLDGGEQSAQIRMGADKMDTTQSDHGFIPDPKKRARVILAPPEGTKDK